MTGQIGTITRDDGTKQVTLAGMPLYLFAGDSHAGDVTGQGVGGVWWAVAPDGAKVTGSAAASSSAAPPVPGTDAGEDPGAAAREESLRALYDEHAPVLLAYALRLTDGDRVRAEDIVQETLLRAWRNLDRLDGNDGPVRPWLFTVAQHLAIDAHRARRARPTEVGDAVLAALPALDELEHTLDRIIVTDALGLAVPRAPGRDRRDLLPGAQRGRGGAGARDPARHRQVALLLRAAGAETGPRRTRGDDMTCPRYRARARCLRARCARSRRARGRVDEHLRACPDCAAELAEFEALPALLDRVRPGDLSLDPVTPSPGLFARLTAAAAAAVPPRSRTWTPWAAVVIAVLGVGAGVVSWMNATGRTCGAEMDGSPRP